MLYIVYTTGRCNLNCEYCGGSFPEHKVPAKPLYEVKQLKRFMEGDEEPIIAFYGGEPLLNAEFIEEVMDSFERCRFVAQTNATLIDRLPAKYWRRMDAVLISIDGRREVTDGYRGPGVYDLALRGAAKLRSMGFKGDLIARMTLSRRSDLYKDVTHLLSLKLFDHVHWQLDLIWSPRWPGLDRWVEGYREALSRLFKLWLTSLREGEVLGIAPFLGVLKHLLTRSPVEAPPCGAGSSSVAILTNGLVLACPIAVDEEWARVGRLDLDSWRTVRGKVRVEEPCPSCSIFNLCGGRCLYTNKERLWGEDGFKTLCELTSRLIYLIQRSLGEVEDLLRRGVVGPEELLYPPFNNTIEVIP